MSEPINDGGLVRGKRLVWVFDGPNYAEAVSQFGEYECFPYDGGFHWTIDTLDTSNMCVVNQGQEADIIAAQSACQSDHDLRAMASIQVGPFEWGADGNAVVQWGVFTLKLDGMQNGEWIWSIHLESKAYEFGVTESREKAIEIVQQFATRLVMGERE